MHLGSPSNPSCTAATKAKPRYVYSIFKPYGKSSRSLVRPLLSKVQPCCIHSILKPHCKSSRRQVRLLLSKVKPSYVYSISKPHSKISRSSVRLLLSKVKLSYLYSVLNPFGLSFRNSYFCFQQHFIASPCGFKNCINIACFTLLSSGLTGLLEL